jgi:hypothetical protein
MFGVKGGATPSMIRQNGNPVFTRGGRDPFSLGTNAMRLLRDKREAFTPEITLKQRD